ncbi:MAG TPA: DUF4349 domain-containing protein, partial [Planctomycetota bacterium]|nr:DUF4349 domain-containing protein [Planctomycetota bacterium]
MKPDRLRQLVLAAIAVSAIAFPGCARRDGATPPGDARTAPPPSSLRDPSLNEGEPATRDPRLAPPPPAKRDLGDGKDSEPLGDPPLPGSGSVDDAVREGAIAAPMVIYTGDIALAVADVPSASTAARAIAVENGGYLQSLAEHELTIRVPGERYLVVVDRVAALGVVRARDIRGIEVGEEVIDLRARLANAESVRGRIQALIDRSATIGDALTLHRELARITGEIEQIQSRLNGLNRRAAFGTLAIRFNGPDPLPVVRDAPVQALPDACAWVGAIGAEALHGRAYVEHGWWWGPDVDLPRGFIAYAERKGVTRALSANAVHLRLAGHDNLKGADAAFWQAHARRALIQRGFAIADEGTAGSVAWHEGRLRTASGERACFVAIIISDGEAVVFEAWGATDAVA